MATNNSKRPPTALSNAARKIAKSERHDAEFFEERKKRDAANLQKTMQLKLLRLAKETQDREAAAAAKASAPPTARKSRAVKAAVSES
jgi:hypothetical protein